MTQRQAWGLLAFQNHAATLTIGCNPCTIGDMKHAIMLHEQVLPIFLRQTLAPGKLYAYQAASQMDEHCARFETGEQLTHHIQAAREKGIGFLHYVLHADYMGGAVECRQINTPIMQREEMHGDGLIHFYLQSHGPTAWILRMDAPRCTTDMAAKGWQKTQMEDEGERLMRLMRTFTLNLGSGHLARPRHA